jgi:hypothetical protein
VKKVRRDGQKTLFFAKTLSKLRFFYFIVLPHYPLPKTYVGWVRREGYGGSNLGEKSFQLSRATRTCLKDNN